MEGSNFNNDLFSLDVVNVIVFAKDDGEFVLSVRDWGACIVVCKKWHRALKAPVILRIIELAGKESVLDSARVSLGLCTDIARVGALRQWLIVNYNIQIIA